MDEVKINDGGGLYDNVGLIDKLIVDMNGLVKRAFAGEYIGFCTDVISIVQRLGNLRFGVQHDIDSLKQQIDDLRKTYEGGGE